MNDVKCEKCGGFQRRTHHKTMKSKTPKERVLVRHPQAECREFMPNDKPIGFIVWSDDGYQLVEATKLGSGLSAQAAWRNACERMEGKTR